MNEKIEQLEKLEMDAINEDDEESDDESENEAKVDKRRTLLDKVVGDVFGKEKSRLYESK